MKQSSMFRHLAAVILVLSARNGFCQLEFDANSIFSINDGWIQLGGKYEHDISTENALGLGLSARAPLTDQTQGLIQLDRNSSTFKGVFSFYYHHDEASATTTATSDGYLGFNLEFGSKEFTYYPEALQANKTTSSIESFAGELFYTRYATPGGVGAAQNSIHFKARYAREAKAQSAVNVVSEWQPNVVNTAESMIINAPTLKPQLTLGAAYMTYQGSGNWVYAPAVHAFFTGNDQATDPFSDPDNFSLRFEWWCYLFPTISGSPNTRIGLAPFLNYSGNAEDGDNPFMPGVFIQLKFANMKTFF